MSTHFEQFKMRAEAVSAEVHRFASKTEALDFICDFVQTENQADARNAYALWADCPFLRDVDQKQICQKAPAIRFGVNREQAAAATIGISQMNWGIANTGTLVQDASAVEQRLVSTLPFIHIALVGTGDIVPDLTTLFLKTSPKQTNYISFITGPSRTADIERVLTIGVHGPQRLVILCVDELESSAA